MFVTVTNHLTGQTRTYEGDDKTLYAALKADFPMQANFNPDIFGLMEDIRRVHYLDVKSSPFVSPLITSPAEAAQHVAHLTSIDYAPHIRVVLEYRNALQRLPQALEGSSQDVLRQLTERYPDYASFAGNGLKAMMDLINERHPEVTINYGAELDHPRWTGQHNPPHYDVRPPGFPTWEIYNSVVPMPKLIGRTEGFADDSDEL